MSILICGSIAYDNIMVFDGRFQDHILPDQIHILNVAFLVPEMRQEFGGCAGNIAYNLRLLDEEPLIMATVGRDFDAYRRWLDAQRLDLKYVTEVGEALTAQAYITTDLDDNQLTAFHPGAMDHAHVNAVPAADSIALGIVSPDGRQAMLDHAAQFAAAGVRFIFDPGQGLPMFDGEDLRRFVDQATWVTVNDYEGKLLSDRTGWDFDAIAARVDALIVTRGGQGSIIYAEGECLDIPAVKPTDILDPTGCGDAYRAGLLFGINRGMSWADTGRLASLIGARKIAHRGTQNHRFSRESLADDFAKSFGYEINI
ncbi:MAG: carbohydrate kinase family protein [Gammaproteobacteria bacterium]|nr:carbohydrate kinase family protein [Gammaproteobacteria bacterium]